MTVICKFCGAEISGGSLICRRCGRCSVREDGNGFWDLLEKPEPAGAPSRRSRWRFSRPRRVREPDTRPEPEEREALESQSVST